MNSAREARAAPLINGGHTKPKPKRRVLFLRHGEGQHNLRDEEVPDAMLTAYGRTQAESWKGVIGTFGAEVVLVSPLRRAVETACLAFADEDVPLLLCRHAREKWWDDKSNIPGTPSKLRKLLRRLPRGAEVTGVEEALGSDATCEHPQNEQASIAMLQRTLATRPESVVAVACHWGVIHDLTGCSADNCEVIDCAYDEATGVFKLLERNEAPVPIRAVVANYCCCQCPSHASSASEASDMSGSSGL